MTARKPLVRRTPTAARPTPPAPKRPEPEPEGPAADAAESSEDTAWTMTKEEVQADVVEGDPALYDNGSRGHAEGFGMHNAAKNVTTYPPADKATPPPNSYILEDGDQVKKSWFDEDPSNDNLVAPKKDIIRKFVPTNSVTPVFLVVATAGHVMTKIEAEKIRG